jgi:hypothetical protein
LSVKVGSSYAFILWLFFSLFLFVFLLVFFLFLDGLLDLAPMWPLILPSLVNRLV